MKFNQLEARAEDYFGSKARLQEMLPTCQSTEYLSALSKDRYLSAMSKCVFRAGFVWKVVDNKWPGFEEAFNGFNPLVVANYSDEKLETLAKDTRIIRYFTNIKATRANAAFILDTKRLTGSHFPELVAGWPSEEIVELWWFLKKHGSRLGGNTGPGFLRLVGKDTFMLSHDVITALVNYGFMDKISPNTKRDLAKVQLIFNEFQQQSGRTLCEISRILSYTVNQKS